MKNKKSCAMFCVVVAILVSFFSSVGLCADRSSTNKRFREEMANEEGHDVKRAKSANKILINTTQELRSFKDLSVDSVVADKGITLVFFDIDGTVLRPRHPLFDFDDRDQDAYLDTYFESLRCQSTEADFTDFKAFIKNLQDHTRKDFIRDEVLVEERVAEFIKELSQKKNVVLMALTARSQLGRKILERSLKKYGITFGVLSKLGDYKNLFGPRGHGTDRGVFYTARHGVKIDKIRGIVEDVMRELNVPGPFTCSFFEDSSLEIKACENAQLDSEGLTSNITIQPYYYTYHRRYLHDLDDDDIYDDIDELFDAFIEERNKAMYNFTFMGSHESIVDWL